eukprot:4579812-Karenia_brevis.AAC.1
MTPCSASTFRMPILFCLLRIYDGFTIFASWISFLHMLARLLFALLCIVLMWTTSSLTSRRAQYVSEVATKKKNNSLHGGGYSSNDTVHEVDPDDSNISGEASPNFRLVRFEVTELAEYSKPVSRGQHVSAWTGGDGASAKGFCHNIGVAVLTD